METLAVTLKVLREKRGLSMEQLAEKANVSKGIIGEIERNKTRSSVKTLNKIALALELTQEEKNKLDAAFLGREIGYEKEIKKQLKDPIKMITIPVYESVAAGMGYIPEATPIDYISIPEISGECIAIKVIGDSMEPTFYSNDLVVLKKDIEVLVGEIGVFLNKSTGEAVVKRLKKKNGVYVLESDNHIFKDMEIKTDEMVCCGKVINVIKKDLRKKINPLQQLLDEIPGDKLELAEKLLKTLISHEEK